MDIRERLIIRTDGRLKQLFPKTAALRPPRLEMSGLFYSDAIDLARSHLDDSSRDRRGHAKDEIERARHRATDRPGVHQDLAQERRLELDFRRLRGIREQIIGTSLARAPPTLGALKIQVDEKDRAAPRPLAHAGVHLPPQRRERRGVVRPRARGNACSTGAP